MVMAAWGANKKGERGRGADTFARPWITTISHGGAAVVEGGLKMNCVLLALPTFRFQRAEDWQRC
jgi:hypothetical protein